MVVKTSNLAITHKMSGTVLLQAPLMPKQGQPHLSSNMWSEGLNKLTDQAAVLLPEMSGEGILDDEWWFLSVQQVQKWLLRISESVNVPKEFCIFAELNLDKDNNGNY